MSTLVLTDRDGERPITDAERTAILGKARGKTSPYRWVLDFASTVGPKVHIPGREAVDLHAGEAAALQHLLRNRSKPCPTADLLHHGNRDASTITKAVRKVEPPSSNRSRTPRIKESGFAFYRIGGGWEFDPPAEYGNWAVISILGDKGDAPSSNLTKLVVVTPPARVDPIDPRGGWFVGIANVDNQLQDEVEVIFELRNTVNGVVIGRSVAPDEYPEAFRGLANKALPRVIAAGADLCGSVLFQRTGAFRSGSSEVTFSVTPLRQP